MQQLLGIHWFEQQDGQFLLGQAVHPMLDLIQCHAGQQNDRQRSSMLLKVGQHLKSISLRHVEIQQEQVDIAFLEIPKNRMAVARLGDGVSILPEVIA